jgi:hypothetical protein
MRKLINKKVRNTDNMACVARREGDSNDCYSTYSRLMKDSRDNTYYLWSGHFWAGLGDDSLTLVEDVIDFLERSGWSLSGEEAEEVEELLDLE